MKSGLRVLFGLALALLFTFIVIGSISLALLETGGRAIVQAPTHTATYIEHAFPTFINIVPGQPSITPVPSDTPVFLESPTSTMAPKCLLPDGWIEIVLQPGDTLDNVAARYGIDPATLASMNCMKTNTMIVDAIFYVPSPGLYDTPTPTRTMIASATPTVHAPVCGPPLSWVQYTIRRGGYAYLLERGLRGFYSLAAICELHGWFGNFIYRRVVLGPVLPAFADLYTHLYAHADLGCLPQRYVHTDPLSAAAADQHAYPDSYAGTNADQHVHTSIYPDGDPYISTTD